MKSIILIETKQKRSLSRQEVAIAFVNTKYQSGNSIMTYSIEAEADSNAKSFAPLSIVTISNEQAIAQAELDAYIEAQAQEIAPEIEIDSTLDSDFGELYRVWHGCHLLGTFKRAIDGLWVVQSNHTNSQPRCNTAAEAQLLIVATAGLPVADIGTEEADIDHLLDLPFDELTPSEWERLKQHSQTQKLLVA